MPRTIVLDCDGVILDWRRAFHAWLRLRDPRAVLAQPDDYSMLSALPGRTMADIQAAVEAFNRSADFAHLPYCDGAEAGVRTLRVRYPDARIVVLTSVGAADVTAELRRANLSGLPIDDVICTPLHVSKEPRMAEMPAPALIVEDHHHHAQTAAELGLAAILIDRPWNRAHHHPKVERARDWTHVLEIAAARFEVRPAA